MKKYFFKNRLLFFITIFFIFLCSLTDIAQSFLLQYIIDGIHTKISNFFILATSYSALFILACFLADNANQIFSSKLIKKAMLNLKEDIFSNVLNKNLSSFNEQNSAKYISMLTNDINIIQQDYFNNVFQMIRYIFSFVFALISLIKINIYLTISILTIGWLPLLISKAVSKKTQFYKSNYSSNLENFTTQIKDIFSGFEVIKSFNIVKETKTEFERINTSVETANFKSNIYGGFVESLISSSGILLFFINILIGAYFVINSNLTIGTLIASIQLMNYVVNPLLRVSSLWNKLKSVNLIYNKITDISDDEPIKETVSKNEFNNFISFSNIDFSYDNEKKIINNFSLKIEKNKKYAIVGESGSGKSTIIKLLLKYYNNYNGDIIIDSTNLQNINNDSLYNLVSMIHQNVFMFDDTIKNNISLYQNYTDEQINTAINLSGLNKVIKSLPNGKDSLVGENGKNLSGGEKQRVSIARSLIKNTPILILDEVTSALDNKTAFEIEKSILDLDDVTLLSVTHRLSKDILPKYDSIIVMKNGKIIEQGNFDDLLKNNGYFYSLYYLENNN